MSIQNKSQSNFWLHQASGPSKLILALNQMSTKIYSKLRTRMYWKGKSYELSLFQGDHCNIYVVIDKEPSQLKVESNIVKTIYQCKAETLQSG